MSWWTDGEQFDEYDPPYCKGCESLSCEGCIYEDGEKVIMFLEYIYSGGIGK